MPVNFITITSASKIYSTTVERYARIAPHTPYIPTVAVIINLPIQNYLYEKGLQHYRLIRICHSIL